MFRTSTTDAIVLRKVRVGEIHKSLTLLSPSKGLLSAMAHGACKIRSRLRTASEPFNVIRAYLYHEPVRDQYKITDIESLHPLDGIRRSLDRYYAASLWAEVAIKSYGAGESHAGMYHLLLACLRLLDAASGRSLACLTVQYLMRFLDLLGQRPNLGRCGLCAVPFEPGSGLYLSRSEVALVCRSCAAPGSLYLPPGAHRYLCATAALPLEPALRSGLEEQSMGALKQALYCLVQSALESGLNTLKCGAGIL